MADLLMHPATAAAISRYQSRGGHALMLIGGPGMGKLSLARWLAGRLLGIDPSKLDNQPYFLQLTPSGSLSIDQIRQLQRFLQLKTTGQAKLRRVVIIEDSHTMTLEAQNALLKILEEPPLDSVLILTAQGERNLRPTIYSRVHQIRLQSPSQHLAESFWRAEGHKPADIQKAYLITGGAPGLMHGLLTQADEHPLLKQISEAKSLLAATPYERLARLNELAQKETVEHFLYALKRVITAALHQSSSKGLSAWQSRLKRTLKAEAALATNPNLKLLLTDLFLEL